MKKKLIITGCNGQLGRAINKQLAGNEDYELVNTDVAELDITDIDKVMEMAREVKPYAILNCAAFTNVNAASNGWWRNWDWWTRSIKLKPWRLRLKTNTS